MEIGWIIFGAFSSRSSKMDILMMVSSWCREKYMIRGYHFVHYL